MVCTLPRDLETLLTETLDKASHEQRAAEWADCLINREVDK
jgi:hypothetical protein